MLVSTQVALAMVLVVGASLLVETVTRLQSLDLGFEPRNVSTVWLSLSGPKYQERAAILAFWSALRDRVRREPSIESVGLSGAVPFAGGSGAGLAIQGRVNAEPLPPIRYGVFSDGAVATFGVALRSGRDFSRDDRANSNPVVLINEAAAKKFWPGQDPIGARIRLGPDPTVPWAEVVGVIGDYRQEQLDAAPPALAIQNFQQDVWSSMFVTMKSREPASALHATLAKIVGELDPGIAVGEPMPLLRLIGGELGPRRFAMSILTAFGAIALLLALVGVYGVISYGVTARRQEFGVRVALGAMPGELLRSVLREGAMLAVVGLAVGVIAALLLTRFLSNLLFGVQPLDVATFVGAAAALGVATLVACWLPARRAANADPMVVLRED
jgi:predicted permease